MIELINASRLRGAALTILAAAVVFTLGYQFPDQFPDAADNTNSDRWNAWLQVAGFGGSSVILLVRTLRWTWLGRAIVWVFLGAASLYFFVVAGSYDWGPIRTMEFLWGTRFLVSFGMAAYLTALITGEIVALRDRMRFRASVVGIPHDHIPPDVIMAALVAAKPIVISDDQGRMIYVTESVAKLVGSPVNELQGRNLTTIIPDSLRERHKAGLAQTLRTGTGPLIGKTVQVPLLRRDGTEVSIRLSISMATVGQRSYFIASIWDSSNEITL